MRILVTGGAGFIGSHIVDRYLTDGHDVWVLDNLVSGHEHNLSKRAHLHKMRLLDPLLPWFVKDHKFDVVNHHAAQTSVSASMQLPAHDAENNIIGTIRLLEACNRGQVKKFIYASSGGTYYGECNRAAVEEDPPNPKSYYGISKMSAEMYVRLYCDEHTIPNVVLRYGNVYGPRQDPKGEAGVVSIFANQLLKGEKVTVNGSGVNVRDYVYVTDVARANEDALNISYGVFNIGTGIPMTTNEILSKLLQIIPESTSEVTHGPEREGDLLVSCLSPLKAVTKLNWMPICPLEQGLINTVKHLREHHG